MAQTFPKWATPERRLWLAYQKAIRLNPRLDGWQTDLLTGEIYNPEYEKVRDLLRDHWKADDRDERAALRRREQESLHPKERIRQGGFDSIMRDAFMAEQPTWYPEAAGIDALRCQPVVKVRLASSPVRLWVDVPAPLPPPAPEIPPAPEGGWSRNARRKFKRYGKGPIARAIANAVDEYRNS